MISRRTARQHNTPPETYQGRLQQLRNRLKDDGDAVLISHPPDQRYLTGFSGQDSLVLVTAKRVLLITDSRFTEQARRQCPWVKRIARKGPIVKALADACDRLAITTLRCCPQYTTVGFHQALRKALSGNSVRLLKYPAPANTLRRVKDPAELQQIEQAVRIAEKAFTWLRPRIKPGVSERQLAAMLEYKMKLLGAEGPAFKTIVACGANSALPHAPVGSDVVIAGKPVVFDWGAVVNGYCSDLTRTVAVGTMPQRLRKIYQTVLEAQTLALASIKAGVQARVVDKAARDHIRKAGYGKNFGHGLGHGLGLEVHEQPVLHARSEQVLQAGMVVTVEPGIYVPGYGGVRIEDDVLVTETGCRVLSRLNKQLPEAVL